MSMHEMAVRQCARGSRRQTSDVLMSWERATGEVPGSEASWRVAQRCTVKNDELQPWFMVTYMYIYIYRERERVRDTYVYIHIYIYIYTCVYIYNYIYIYMYMYIYVCYLFSYKWMYVCKHVYIYIYIERERETLASAVSHGRVGSGSEGWDREHGAVSAVPRVPRNIGGAGTRAA